MSRQRSGKRTWLAVALALVYPGAGHLYLREGLRALLWFALVFATTALSVPASAIPDSGELSIETIMAASQALPTAAMIVSIESSPESGIAEAGTESAVVTNTSPNHSSARTPSRR